MRGRGYAALGRRGVLLAHLGVVVACSCGVGWGGEERVWGGAVRSVWWWWVLCQVPLRPLGRCTALLSAVPQAAYIIGAAAPGTVGVLMLSLCLAGSAREYLGAFRILRRGPPFRGARAARSYLGAFRIVRRGPPFRCALCAAVLLFGAHCL